MGVTNKKGQGGIGSHNANRAIEEENAIVEVGEGSSKHELEVVKEIELEIPKKRAPRQAKIQKKVYIDAFNKCEYVQTRWGDKETLEKLGILEDVQSILKNIGFEKVLDMRYLVYPWEVAQLLGSIEFKYDFKNPEKNLGLIRFTVNGFGYKLTIKELCNAYGFKYQTNHVLENNQAKDGVLWKMIGKESYKPGKAKAGCIGNPGVRYVHKLLAHTMFARKATDKIREDEMALLCNGVKPLQEREFERRAIGGYEDFNLGILLVKKILYLKKTWVLKPREEVGKIYIGGFLTPLLIASGVPLGLPSPKPLKFLDTNHLLKISFISGREGEKIVYNFVNSNRENTWVYLPNQDITKMNSLMNITFSQGEKFVIKEHIDPAPIGRRDKGKSVNEESSQHEVPLGSARYYQSPYQGRVQSEATRHALEGVKKNQRCNKWQSRAIHNLKKGFKKRIKGLEDTISGMSETITGLKDIVEKFVLRKHSPPRYEDGSSSYGLALEEARRKSTSHLPSHTSTIEEEPSRASSYEIRALRRKRRHIPTPSPPSSDNASFHLSDSYSES